MLRRCDNHHQLSTTEGKEVSCRYLAVYREPHHQLSTTEGKEASCRHLAVYREPHYQLSTTEGEDKPYINTL